MLDVLMVCASADVEEFGDAIARHILGQHAGSGVVVAGPDVDGIAAVDASLDRPSTRTLVAIVVFGHGVPAPGIVAALPLIVHRNPPMLIVLAPGSGEADTSMLSGFIRRIRFEGPSDERALTKLRESLDEIDRGDDWKFKPIQAAPPAPLRADPSPPTSDVFAYDVGAEEKTTVRQQPRVRPPQPASAWPTPPPSVLEPVAVPGVPPPHPAPLRAGGGLLGRIMGGLFGAGHGSRESRSKPPETTQPSGDVETTSVILGASAPRAAAPGDEFTARFVAYRPELEAAVKSSLLDLSPGSTPHLGMARCQWVVGTTVAVSLKASHLTIEPASQAFTWDGTKAVVEFDVAVPDDAAPGAVVLKFEASIDDIVVATLRVDFRIAARDEGLRAEFSPPSSVTVQAARTAFASYSSSDRQRVLDRVAAVRISAGLDVFLDCLSLHPGQEWLPRLETEIRQRDLFLLFWSGAAAKSDYVSWEWRTALRERGKQAMQIHPLEVGMPPPDELRDLHFGDVYMLARKATAPPT